MGLTLLELVVVLSILVILAGLIVPNVGGLIFQSRNASNAALVRDVNHAVNSYIGRIGEQPDRWDSLLDSTSNTYFNKLHPQLLTSSDTLPVLQVITLTSPQAQSLIGAGIRRVIDADDARSTPGATGFVYPSDNASAVRNVATGGKMVALVKSTNVPPPFGATFMDRAFGINPTLTSTTLNIPGKWENDFVVVGLGSQNAMRGSTMADIPVVQSATPLSYYSRVLCVYMIPASTATVSFPARYIGSFLPDGTSLPANVQDYNTAAAVDK
jgi:type II secretory pathway pseudopilin PulG